MDVSTFEEIATAPLSNQIYWKEMLYRVYWAATLNLTRHKRWQSACVSAYDPKANLLGFAASLRGLLEAALDANYSLSPAPRLLADNRIEVEAALNRNLNGSFAVSPELEDRLIHFVYGRKLSKTDKTNAPSSHGALEPKDYRSAAGFPDTIRENFKVLYDELCGLSHPTAFSLAFLWSQNSERDRTVVRIVPGSDDAEIATLCKQHSDAIEFSLSLSVTLSALCLKTLNWFSLPEVKSPWIESWNFDSIPLWTKIQAASSAGSIH